MSPDDHRPDPDHLLARVQEEESRAKRGKLKIFFGASAGVGKTYAMLSTARQQQTLGTDVIIGVVETHGRKETDALVAGFERLPLRAIAYRGQTLEEFDIDAALARAPALILMDELAHSNVAGSRHPKRWQDVHELVEAGIDVYTTVNVQHLETLNDVVSGITGIRVWETVPDHVFDEANEIVLVDLPPDELLQRLREGKVYLPQQAERAVRNFFRKGNLIALRELALRRTADRVDEEMLAYRREIAVGMVWHTGESLLVCIGGGAGAERLVRTGARMAGRIESPWHVIHIETQAQTQVLEAQRQRIVRALELASSLGAETATLTGDDQVASVLNYARKHNLSRIVVGRDHPRPWHPWYRSFADRIGHAAPDLDVIQVARSEGARDTAPLAKPVITSSINSAAYLKTALICAAATVLATPLAKIIELTNIAMLFLLVVLVVAVRLGRGPAVAAAFFAVASFDFFFVPPRLSFAVSDAQYLITFVVMLLVALITGQLTARYKQHAEIATRREARAHALYDMARDLSAALLPVQIEETCRRFLAAEFEAQAVLLLADMNDHLQHVSPKVGDGDTASVDDGTARWTFDHGEAAGLGTDTLPGSPLLYLPLKAPMRTRGVLVVVAPRDPLRVQGPEARRQLETFASLVAITVERIHYVEVAQNTLLQMESEGLRNSLLTAISHDLRTPLSVLVGLAESMAMTQPPPTGAQAKIAEALQAEARRMSLQVDNLLEMARLQAGKVHLHRQWQPLEEVVGSALKATQMTLGARPVRVVLPDDLPLLDFDGVLIERVFCNLLENVAKYTPPGTQVTIGATVLEREVDVWVEDNGPGLPKGREETLFQKFERGVKEGTTPGVGLGLAICRAIVAAHDGTIRAENRVGGGVRFIFSLPRGTPPTVSIEHVEQGPTA